MTEIKLTCQICGRGDLKIDKYGRVSKHGYKQPRKGARAGMRWGTCPGSLCLPYEQANDALAKGITDCEAFVTQRSAWLTEFEINPPATLDGLKYTGAWTAPKAFTVERPAGFSKATVSSFRRDHDSYGDLYLTKLRETQADIEAARSTKYYLAKRLAEWKAPQAA